MPNSPKSMRQPEAASQSSVRSLGTLLKRLRGERELTQKQVARDLGISQSALSAWESGTTLPPRAQVQRIATVLRTDIETLQPYFEKAESEETYAPRSVGRIHFQAAQHVKRYGPENLSIWILGATNLSVMENAQVQERWCANLLRGIDYNLIWFLDLVAEETLRAAIAVFAEIEKRVAAEGNPEGSSHLGRISHFASNAYERPAESVVHLYHQLEQAFAESRDQSVPAASRVHPYIEQSDTGTAAEAAVAQASRRLLRSWQPETGMVLYRPKTITTPPAANIRLMPVTEHIVEGLSSESERSQYWFWLSPRGAARLNIAVGAFEQAMLDIERERRGRAT